MRALKKLVSVVASGTTQLLNFTLGIRVPTFTSVLAPTAPGFIGAMATLVDGAAVAVNALVASTFTLTCANNNARVISVPTGGVAGQRIVVQIVNTSGGALTVTTFNAAIKQPALTLPATGTFREYELMFDGTEWSLVDFSGANVPN